MSRPVLTAPASTRSWLLLDLGAVQLGLDGHGGTGTLTGCRLRLGQLGAARASLRTTAGLLEDCSGGLGLWHVFTSLVQVLAGRSQSISPTCNRPTGVVRTTPSVTCGRVPSRDSPACTLGLPP